MKTTISRFLLSFAAIIALFACDGSAVYDTNTSIEDHVWNNKQKLVFEVPIEDSIGIHNVYINVRNTGNYGYKNLFLFVETTAPSGAMLRDTFECVLADDKGRWYGSGIGDIWSARVPYKKNIRFPETGTYSFRLEQAMREADLKEVMDIGVRVEKVSL